MDTTEEATVVDLGEKGTARPPVNMHFTWFGARIRVAPDAGDLGLIDFLERASQINARDRVTAMRATREFLRGQIHPDDWPTVIELAKANHQQFSDLLQLARDIVEAVSLFPTGRPSDSGPGRPSTQTNSTGDYASQAAAAIRACKDRPDLKRLLYQAYVARTAEARSG